jgi:hypothetical protein
MADRVTAVAAMILGRRRPTEVRHVVMNIGGREVNGITVSRALTPAEVTRIGREALPAA